MTSLLEIRNVSKNYDSFQALRDVSFGVAKSEVFAIIGPNGAGKTTLFKVMTGEVYCDVGEVLYNDQDISRLSADQRVNIGLGRTFQIARVFPKYSAMDNVIVAIEARNRSRMRKRSWLFRIKPNRSVREEAAEMLIAVGLGNNHRTEAAWLSLGDRKRLELAVTLALEPAVLMLDEPTAGMSPSERHSIIDLIAGIKDDLGLTIVLTEHDMDFVFRLAGRLMVLNQGQVVAIDTPSEIRSNSLVREIYLGKKMVNA